MTATEDMNPDTGPPERAHPLARQIFDALDDMKRQIDLLSWHVAQGRDLGVREEIAGGIHNVDRSLRALRQSID